ncbi:MFS transporter [Streptomyces sp. CB03238]|uniref:MFS transporter n=1 Tax=Streptomyces sp. CB03238 TaxID=1907777 RepID=UPI000A11EF3D|nr:MFS transporter [Streptomyces sp. CB03238]ORT60671.1 hypothetical protein BKD26_05395 [Streptomyces sp. CB03238]
MTRLFRSYFGGVTRAIAIVSLGVFINRLGGFFTLFLTLILTDRGYEPGHITFALVAVAVAGMAGAGVAGKLSDWLGLRGALLLSSTLTALCAFASAVVEQFALTVVVSCLLNAGVQAYGPAAQTVVGVEASDDRRVGMFAVYRLAMNLGVTVGPLLGAFLMDWSMTALLVGNGIAATAATLLLLALPRRLGRAAAVPDGEGKRRGTGPAVRMNRGFIGAAVLFGLISLVYAQQTGSLALAIHDSDHDQKLYGWLLTLNAVLVILVEIPLSRYSSRWARRTTVVFGAVCVCGGYAVNLFGISLGVLIAGVLIWTLGEILVAPVAAAFSTEVAPDGAASKYLSFLGLCQTTGMSIGPAAGVFAYSHGTSLPWAMCAVVLVITAGGLFYLVPRCQLAAKVSADGSRPDSTSRQPA